MVDFVIGLVHFPLRYLLQFGAAKFFLGQVIIDIIFFISVVTEIQINQKQKPYVR
jgi:hypothetical protein